MRDVVRDRGRWHADVVRVVRIVRIVMGEGGRRGS